MSLLCTLCPSLSLVLEWGCLSVPPWFCMWRRRSVSVSSRGSIFNWWGDWVTQVDWNNVETCSAGPQRFLTAGRFFIHVFHISIYLSIFPNPGIFLLTETDVTAYVRVALDTRKRRTAMCARANAVCTATVPMAQLEHSWFEHDSSLLANCFA